MSELRAKAARINGLKGGIKKGTTPKPSFKLDADSVVDEVAGNIITGKRIICAAPKLSHGVLGLPDRKRMTAMLGVTIEEFNARMGEKLAILSDKIVQRIEEKIDEDTLRPGNWGLSSASPRTKDGP